MAVQEATFVKPSFGAGARLVETFSLIGRRPLIFLGFTLVVGVLLPALLIYVVMDLIMLTTNGGPESDDSVAAIVGVVVIVITAVTQSLCFGVLTLAAYDANVGERRTLRTYLGLSLRRMLKLVLVMLGLGILVGLGYAIIVLLGLWMTAVYAAILPIVMVEGSGYAAFGRARSLSKEYRWPIVGYLLLLGIIVVALVSVVVAALAATGNDTAIIIAPLVSLLLLPLFTIATCLGSVTIYARLLAIKEGRRGADIADVFA